MFGLRGKTFTPGRPGPRARLPLPPPSLPATNHQSRPIASLSLSLPLLLVPPCSSSLVPRLFVPFSSGSGDRERVNPKIIANHPGSLITGMQRTSIPFRASKTDSSLLFRPRRCFHIQLIFCSGVISRTDPIVESENRVNSIDVNAANCNRDDPRNLVQCSRDTAADKSDSRGSASGLEFRNHTFFTC